MENEVVKATREDIRYAELNLKRAQERLVMARETWQNAINEVKFAENQLKLRRRELFAAIEGK